MFGFGLSGSGVFGRSVDPSDKELLCLRIVVKRFSAGSDRTTAEWKLSLSVSVSGARLIGSSGSGAVSDLCSGSVVSGFVLHDKEEVQSKCLNGVLCTVGSPPTKLRESLLLSDSGGQCS
jgi:hypothetical protein